jgi:hypothetical protein
MADDWRVTARLHEEGLVERLLDRLRRNEVEDQLLARLAGRVVVTSGPGAVFAYAGDEADARQAERLLNELSEAEVTVDRWHPIEERWEDAGVPLPQTEAEREAEHRRREDQETEQSQLTHLAEWEVRLELESHREASALADRLAAEGMRPVRRWKYLVVGANNEDEANELAERLRREAPAAAVSVEAGPAMDREGTAHTLLAVWFG